MCGIAGKINFRGENVTEAEVAKMTTAIAHRGPDDSGVFVDGVVGMGHRRLSIIDTSDRGHQPMQDMSGRYTIVFNGEIYNFREIRRELERAGVVFNSNSDTEVLINLYAKEGPSCISRLQGMFAFAIWDSKAKELCVARDRIGKKPLKYYVDSEQFLFASELKAILATDSVEREVDWAAIDQFLTHKYVPAPRTGFKNIYKLRPGTYALVKKGRVIESEYWDIGFKKKLDLTEEEWLQRIEATLTEAVKARLFSNVPLGVHLSGGVDSSLITAIAAEVTDAPITTLSIGFEESEFNELPYARMVAKRYGTKHIERHTTGDIGDSLPEIVGQYEEPYSDASNLPTWVLAGLTKEQVTVVLTGDGGDENFGGYERHLIPKLHRILRFVSGKKFFALLFRVVGLDRYRHVRNIVRLFEAYDSNIFEFYINIIAQVGREHKLSIYTKQLKETITAEQKENPVEEAFSQAVAETSLDRFLYTGLKTFLPDDLLVKVDIATMAHGVEARSPFLDYRMLELTAQMPDSLKVKGWNKKYALKKLAEKYIPKECIYRPKKGFTVPVAEWLRTDLNSLLRESLIDDQFARRGFNTAYIRTMIEEHESGKKDHADALWALLNLRLWLRHWFE